MSDQKTLVIVINSFDKSYIPFLKPLIKGVRVHAIIAQTITTISQLSRFALDNKADGIVISGNDHLDKVLKHNGLTDEKPTHTHWAGSMLQLDGIPLIYIAPISHLVSVPHAEFVTKRFLSKLLSPKDWNLIPELTWELADTPTSFPHIKEFFSKALLISIDIETVGMYIRCCGFTGLFKDDKGKLYSHTVVVPMESMPQYQLIKDICENNSYKIYQNGNYDNTYLLRFRIATNNYLFDTYHIMHSWMVELPKNLGFIAAFFMLNFKYWKYEADSGNLSDLYFYNAKDCHATLWSFIAMLEQIPDWATTNYLMEFPGVFPSIQCGLDGFKVDEEERKRLLDQELKKEEKALSDLQVMIDPDFNPNSSQQTLALMHATGFKEAKDSREPTMLKWADAHPLYSLISEKIIEVRGARKLISTYLQFDQLDGRLLYKLDPAGTDSGRYAAQQSNFSQTRANTKGKFVYDHYGVQVQNIPGSVKSMLVPDDEEWRLAETDYSQSESRTTGYITQDKALIEAVETSPDFHCTNASMFFGIPFEELYDVEKHKKLNVTIRDLAKRTNHGFNYCMGEWKLWQTMGDKNVRMAQKLLKIPSNWKPVQVTKYLLDCVEKTYPVIHGTYMDGMVREVVNTGMSVIPCKEFPWSRMTFLRPEETKHHRNSLMSFKPQSLSGLKLNKSFYLVWKQFQIIENRIRMKAPIHDSLVFAHKVNDEKVIKEVQAVMETPMTIHGVQMRIPTDAGYNAKSWKDTK